MTHQKSTGTRAEVFHGTAKHTSGGLEKKHLLQNKHGRIVSKKKHHSEKKNKRLVKAGYGTKKGKFGFVKLDKKMGGRSHKNHSLMLGRSRAGGDAHMMEDMMSKTQMGGQDYNTMMMDQKKMDDRDDTMMMDQEMGGKKRSLMLGRSRAGGQMMGKMKMGGKTCKMGGKTCRAAYKMGGKSRKYSYGGNGTNYPLSPTEVSGMEGTTAENPSVNVQFAAGMGN